MLKLVAAILDDKLPEGVSVNHPSLPSSKDHARYKADFSQGCGPLISIDCGTKERAFKFLNALKLVILTANIGDNRTLGTSYDKYHLQ